jgi:type II secretory pathway pseudopilin PulG
MHWKRKEKGSLLIITIFVIALLSTVTIGILQMNTSEIKLMQNQVYAAQALALAEAGLNKAFAQIRSDPTWRQSVPTATQLQTLQQDWQYGTKPSGADDFGGGFYLIGYDGSKLLVIAGVNSWHGYTAIIEAQVTVSSSSPHIIRIDNLKVNEYSNP